MGLGEIAAPTGSPKRVVRSGSRRTARSHCALVTALFLGGAAPGTSGCLVHGCTELSCTGGVQIEISDVPEIGAAALLGVCLNETCLEVDYEPTPGCVSEVEGAFTLYFCFYSSGAAYLNLATLQDELLANGDKLEVTLADEAGEVVFTETRQVEYDWYYPNGRDCAPRCRVSAIAL